MCISARRRRSGKPTVGRRLNNGAPGIDGVTFAMIEEAGVEPFLAGIREELRAETYLPMRNRKIRRYPATERRESWASLVSGTAWWRER